MAHILGNITGAFRKNAPLEVLTHPNPLLYQKCEEIDIAHDEDLPSLVKGLVQAMRTFDGVGLAASQAGILKRVLIYDISESQDEPQVLINPVITDHSEELSTADEGCLSFPNIYFPVTRPSRVTVKAYDVAGEPILLEDIEGLLARVVQHECDHLDGVMIVDRAKPHIRKTALRTYATYEYQPEEYITIVDAQTFEAEISPGAIAHGANGETIIFAHDEAIDE
ncbi:MAG: peptide deformylase [Actinomycetia bacterium]|nr:peptide deformylase [Actinomycetes bacterium]